MTDPQPLNQEALKELLTTITDRIVDEMYHLAPGTTEPFLRDNFKTSLAANINTAVLDEAGDDDAES